MQKPLKRTYRHYAFGSLALCAGILLFLDHHPFIRGYGGDVVFVFFFYTLAQSFGPFNPRRCLLAVLGMCFAAEIVQYFRVMELLNLRSPVLKVLLGSVFDGKDLLAYTVGAGITGVVDRKLVQNTPSRRK